MAVLMQSDVYAFHTNRVGATLIRKADNASVYFQPGDAANEAIDLMTGALSELPIAYFNRWCDDYSDLLDETLTFSDRKRAAQKAGWTVVRHVGAGFRAVRNDAATDNDVTFYCATAREAWEDAFEATREGLKP